MLDARVDIGSGEHGFEKHDLTQVYGRAWGYLLA